MPTENLTPEVSDVDALQIGTDILKSVGLPARPEILIKVQAELAKDTPDVDYLAKIIMEDIGIAASVLKLANSSLYAGKRKVESIDQAFIRLGIKIFKNVVITSIAKEKLGTTTPLNEDVWNHTAITGYVCEHLAKRVCPAFVESAYILGLFHDCGIPLLEKRFPEYVDLGAEAIRRGSTKSAEMEKYNTNHEVVAYIVTKTWGLDKHLSEAISRHHDDRIDPSLPDLTKRLLALLMFAEHLVFGVLYGEVEFFTHSEEGTLYSDIREALGISQEEIEDLRHETEILINQRIGNSEAK